MRVSGDKRRRIPYFGVIRWCGGLLVARRHCRGGKLRRPPRLGSFLPSLLVCGAPLKEGEHTEERQVVEGRLLCRLLFCRIRLDGSISSVRVYLFRSPPKDVSGRDDGVVETCVGGSGDNAGGGSDGRTVIKVVEVLIMHALQVLVEELVIETLFRIKSKRDGRFAAGHSGGLVSHLFTFEITFESIEEESVVRYGEPAVDRR